MGEKTESVACEGKASWKMRRRWNSNGYDEEINDRNWHAHWKCSIAMTDMFHVLLY